MSLLVKLFLNERDIARRTGEELEAAYEKLLDSASDAQELAVEKERTRMAREIHDTLAHTLTAAVVQLEACKKLIGVDANRARVQVEKAQEVTHEGLNEVKRTIKALRPQMLENKSFIAAITNLAREAEQNTGVRIGIDNRLPDDFRLSPNIEVTLFRVVQESVTNAVRHGGADRVELSLIPANGLLNVKISDNGRGCSSINKGYGLNGITERVELAGGNVIFSSAAGSGFRTEIAIPMKGAGEHAN
jgi:signal transduction histidine kinase